MPADKRNMSDADYFLDIKGLRDEPQVVNQSPASSVRPWVGIRFDCCSVYTRVYRNGEGTAYLGYCPKCLKKVRLAVGPGGVATRFFTAE